MNLSKIKAYAPKARQDFIEAITNRAAHYGITKDGVEPIQEQGDIAIIGGTSFPVKIVEQRKGLESRIKRTSFEQTMEAIASTWFNRFSAIRFMEMQEEIYFDHGFRVLSHSDTGKATPEILEQAQHIDFPGLDKDKIISLKLDGTKESELYRMLLIAQCNALHSSMPFLFEKLNDETELLLPDSLLHSNSLIRQMVDSIDEEDWQEIEIIGWLYQFYISDKKDQVMGKVVKSEDIPAATQLFTPKWIVQYMVQNSLGHKWMATYPSSPLKESMEYYIEPVEQTEEVNSQLAEITPTELNPEEITFMDPACGSGHILVEAYDLFKEIYTERGYRSREIPRLILEKNLHGLDIDDRAAQLSAFALLMKARADDRRILDEEPKMNVMAIQSSEGLDANEVASHLLPSGRKPLAPTNQLSGLDNVDAQGALSYEAGGDDSSAGDIQSLVTLFKGAKTFGSLITVPDSIKDKIPALLGLLGEKSAGMFSGRAVEDIKPILLQAWMLSQKYDCVVANPPYMGSKGMNGKLGAWIKSNYTDVKSDLFSAFIVRNTELTLPNGHLGFMSPFVWMFISSYENLRNFLIEQKIITSLIQLEYSGFDGATVPICTFTLQNTHNHDFKGGYVRLSDFRGSKNQSPKTLEAIKNPDCGWFYRASAADFKKIPGIPIAYWVRDEVRNIFSDSYKTVDYIASPNQALVTGNTEKYIRKWFETSFSRIGFGYRSREEALNSKFKWFPYNKGGDFRNWYGNFEHIVNWENDGHELQTSLHPSGKRIWAHNFVLDSIFQEAIVWSKITSGKPCFRYSPNGFLYDDASGVCSFENGNKELLLGLFCSKLNFIIQKLINPTLNIQPANLRCVPLPKHHNPNLDIVVSTIINISKYDWDSYERSWDFSISPLLNEKYDQQTLNSNYIRLRKNWHKTVLEAQELEKENNIIFIESFGLHNVIVAEVPLKEITLTCNTHYRYGVDKSEEELESLLLSDTMKELISYSIGCMMGRYSLDQPGLVYAHSGNEGFDHSMYPTFPADDDGIVPVTDRDWFTDDSTNRFVEFIGKAWPIEHLEENLKFVADSLKPKSGESPSDTIRRYLSTTFFKDHMKTYKKRPIYWLFSSGKQKAFECLVYLHRYNEATLSRMRMEYVTPLQGRISSRIDQLAGDVESATSTANSKKLNKERDKLLKQQSELSAFDDKLRHLADKRINLDLDDGVKVNYGKFEDLLAEVKAIVGKKK